MKKHRKLVRKVQKPLAARQGDVLLLAISKDEIPKGLIPCKPVLALGEVTGHSHTMACGTESVECWASQIEGLAEYMAVYETSPLTHQEHSKIDVAPGYYKVIRQTEYTPEALRNVAD